MQPRQGYRVNPISLSDARDLLRFRLALEPASCLGEVIEHAPDKTLQALDGFRSFAGNREDFITYNRAFHSSLAHALKGNRRMAGALCDLIGQADRLVRVSLANIQGSRPDPVGRRTWRTNRGDAAARPRVAPRATLIKASYPADRKSAMLPSALKRNAVIVEEKNT